MKYGFLAFSAFDFCNNASKTKGRGLSGNLPDFWIFVESRIGVGDALVAQNFFPLLLGMMMNDKTASEKHAVIRAQFNENLCRLISCSSVGLVLWFSVFYLQGCKRFNYLCYSAPLFSGF